MMLITSHIPEDTQTRAQAVVARYSEFPIPGAADDWAVLLEEREHACIYIVPRARAAKLLRRGGYKRAAHHARAGIAPGVLCVFVRLTCGSIVTCGFLSRAAGEA